jgi:hypothetical protein
MKRLYNITLVAVFVALLYSASGHLMAETPKFTTDFAKIRQVSDADRNKTRRVYAPERSI